MRTSSTSGRCSKSSLSRPRAHHPWLRPPQTHGSPAPSIQHPPCSSSQDYSNPALFTSEDAVSPPHDGKGMHGRDGHACTNGRAHGWCCVCVHIVLHSSRSRSLISNCLLPITKFAESWYWDKRYKWEPSTFEWCMGSLAVRHH